MSDTRKEYTVTVGGVQHTMLLTDEDAKRYGDNAKAASAANKQGTAKNKGA
jgi:hypothetical protein